MNSRCFGLAGLVLAGVVGMSAVAASVAGLRLNVTASAPVGLWRVTALDPAHVQRGMMVSICPPALRIVDLMRERGYLHVGDCPLVETTPLLKPVIAVAGDRVTVNAKGLTVNGDELVGTAPAEGMPPYPVGTYTVQRGYVWLASTYSRGSFDSRYFGPVSLSNLRGQAAPLIVFGAASGMVGHSFGLH